MPLKPKAKTEGLWQPVPGYPNLEKTSDLEGFQADEQYTEIAKQLEAEVDKKEAADPDFYKNKGKSRIDHTDGYTYQVSMYSGEFQITRWKKGSGKKGWNKGAGFVHTRITKTYVGDLIGFDKLIKKQAADDKWEIAKIIEDAKGGIKQIFATQVKQYTPTAPATATETKSEESESSESESEDSE